MAKKAVAAPDDDYKPDQQDESDSDDTDSNSEFVDDESLDGIWECIAADGTITRVQGPNQTEERVSRLVKEDPAWAELSKRRAVRYVQIAKGASERSKDKTQEHIVMSDQNIDESMGPANVAIIACKIGTWVEDSANNSKTTRYRELTAAEQDRLNERQPLNTPCDCELCVRRERFSASTKNTAEGLRSGKKRDWERYGKGRTLGE